ncbi:hypothetical protein LTR05_008241 [Lithohypha guttulata]|uniref:Amine oxidase n=1 Tax=Lithohypha guttulata TaxID=1690604 RepID=A0AAN7YCT5_9EURO|nr:hypothetical protein LTR05_008241 [Lithohypha guttulata]
MKGIAVVGLVASQLAAVTALPPLGYERKLVREALTARDVSGISCSDGPAPVATAPKTNVWAPITPEDNRAVWDLLYNPATGLNLTLPDDATVTDNYIFWIDTIHANKTGVLPYLDGDGPLPPKYARVVIFEGSRSDPGSQEYMVGPLPVGNTTIIQPYDYAFNGGSGGYVPFNARYVDSTKSAIVTPLMTAIMTNISDITQALFNASYFGPSNRSTTLTTTAGTPVSFDGTQQFRNIMFRIPGVASYMTPIDFFLLINCPGTDPSKFSLKGFVTNEQFFETEADLRAAFEAGELAQEYTQTLDQSWALVDYKPELGSRPFDRQPAPSSIELGGKRYAIDMKEKYVEYMGWSYYMSYTRLHGITFYDIKFKGERILYELSLQEAMAQYAGNQPKAANTVYHDTYYSLGVDIATMIEGYDCPFGATFMNVTYHELNASTVNQDAVCLFESDSGYPLSRHRYGGGNTSYPFTRLGVTKGSSLTVRAIATVGNYDYMFDYSFHVDGSIEITVRASGYLQSSFYYPDQGAWGPRIAQATQGSLHDHIINYKADFDILGTENSLQVSELVVVNVTQPWFPELGSFPQMQLNKSMMTVEQQFNWAPNNEAMYVVLNENVTNAWGEPRGYRLVPGKSDLHLTILDSPWSFKNSEFAKSHLAVTRQHDTEPYSNSWQNINLPMAPQHDYSLFFDGESVEKEDLVVWFNLGMHHYTRAEDVPVTLFTEAQSSIQFAPQNFFDRAQDGDLLNRRYIVVDQSTEEGVLNYEDYGVPLPQCMVAPSEPVLEISPTLSYEFEAEL